MARGEGDASLSIRSHFVERVGRLPMVHSAWDYATNTYSHIKESNRIVHFTLSSAEKTAQFVATQTKPVVLKFEKQIQAVDALACKGLGTLEEKVPFIKKPADEIILNTRKLYVKTFNSRLENIKKYGNDKVKSAADLGLRSATAIFGENLVHSVLSTVDGALIITESYIDHILPPLKEEKTNGVKKEEKVSSLTRLTRMSSTVRRRAYKTLLVQVEYLQEKSLDIFIAYPFSVIEYSKVHLDAAIEYANKLWLAIRQHEVAEEDAEKSRRLEQQLLHLARLISKQVGSAYSSFTPSPVEEGSNSQEPSKLPNALTVTRNGILWVLGMVKLAPQLLPMYIYGLASWLERIRGKQAIEMKAQNGCVSSNNSADHSHSNNVGHDTKEGD